MHAHLPPRSSKLGEENKQIRDARASGVDDKAQAAATREATPDDDEGSVVVEMRRGHPSCGACRTRESETWWRAPKGLATGILCDNCGVSWRKYADLNVRPIRDDALPKAKAGDKREGTPVAAPAAKRAKVRARSSSPRAGPEWARADRVVAVDASTCGAAAALRRLPAQRACREGPAM